MPQTNIVFVDVPAGDLQALQAHLTSAGITAIVGARTRLVTHLDVTREDIVRVVDVIQQFFAKRG
jgi:threonine aldolase